MRLGRVVVGVLGGASAAVVFIVSAVSLTRIAGDYLGFPPGLEWTFTAAVDVAGIAGAAMWTGFTGDVRRIGRPMSIVCTTVSGIGVGLDHATHAGRALREVAENAIVPADVMSRGGWQWAAFAAGLFLPALAAWIQHSLAVMADHQLAPTTGDRETAATRTATPTASAPRAHREPEAQATTRQTASFVATTGNARREATASNNPTPVLQLAPAPPADRPAWMTAGLLDAVVTAAVKAEAVGKPYGEGSVIRDHSPLPDGSSMTSHKAKPVLRYIADHGLTRKVS